MQSDDEPEAINPPRRRGRPPKTENAPPKPRGRPPAAAAASHRGSLPSPPGRIVTGNEFADYTKELTERDWAHAQGYLYRTWPRLTTTDNIDKFRHAIDAEWIMREHGEGIYRASLNDEDIPGTFRTVLRCKHWELRNPDVPPKIPDLNRLSLSDPGNRDYVAKLVRDGKLDTQGNIIMTPTATSADATASAALAQSLGKVTEHILEQSRRPAANDGTTQKVFDQVMTMLSKASDRSLEIALGQVRQQDPDALVKLMIAFKDAFQPAETLTVREVIEIIREMTPKPAPQPKSATEQIRETFELMKTVKQEIGDRATEKWYIPVLDRIPDVVTSIAQMVIGARAPRMIAGGSAPNPLIPPAATTPASSTPQQLNSGTGAGAESETATNQAAAAAALHPEVQTLLQFLPLISTPLGNYLNQGRTGSDFAGWLADSYGEIAYAQVRQMKPEQILTGLAMHPGLRPFVDAMPAEVARFIEEFISGPEPQPANENQLQ